MDTYEYQPLRGETAIRLLYLQGGVGSDDSEMVIQLHEHSLEDCPQYEALSYTWHTPEYDGLHKETIVDGERNQWVVCNDRRIFVTPNCKAALLHLRHQDTTRVLWVDAICINQNNIPERGQQVRLMQKIYSSCQGVLCWIGEGNDNVSALFEYIKLFLGHLREVQRLSQLEQNEDTIRQLQATQEAFKETRSVICQPRGFEQIPVGEGIMSLHHRSYWDRVWVLQEVKAATKKTIFCGHAQLDFDDLDNFLVVNSILDMKAEENDPTQQRYKRSWILGFLNKFKLQTMLLDKDDKTSALEILRSAVNFLSTDPRDKVFALIGLSNQLRELVSTPDYSQTTKEVYTNIAAAVLHATKSLDVLYHCFGQAGEPGLPSWVPDWSSPERDWWQSQIQASGRFQATRGLMPEFEVHLHNTSLKIRGILLDTVDSTAEFYNQSVLDIAHSFRRQQPCHGWNRHSNEAAVYFTSYPYEIWREWCFMSGKCSPGNRISENQPDEDQLWVLFKMKLADPPRYDEYKAWREILQNENLSPVQLAQHIAMSDKACGFDNCTESFLGLTLCTTAGKRLALAPQAVQKDDKIVLIAGCSLPFVVRPHTEGYKVIGASYVTGIMHGEAITDQEKQFETIILNGETAVDEMARLDS